MVIRKTLIITAKFMYAKTKNMKSTYFSYVISLIHKIYTSTRSHRGYVVCTLISITSLNQTILLHASVYATRLVSTHSRSLHGSFYTPESLVCVNSLYAETKENHQKIVQFSYVLIHKINKPMYVFVNIVK